MPVARKVWQPIRSGRPAAEARRLTMPRASLRRRCRMKRLLALGEGRGMAPAPPDAGIPG